MNKLTHQDIVRLMNLKYPLYSEPWFIFVFFCVSLFFVHFGLLRIIKQNELRWHKLDYIWLPMTLFGLLGLTQSNKVEVGRSISVYWFYQQDSELRELNRLVKYFSSDRAYPCIKGVWTENSPPRHIFEAMDMDGQKVCDWYKSLAINVPSTRAGLDDFLIKKLPEPPTLSGHSGSGPESALRDFQDTLNRLKNATMMVEENEAEMKPSRFLDDLRMFSPLIICFALAIRITKVTGEARIKKIKEKAKTSPS